MAARINAQLATTALKAARAVIASNLASLTAGYTIGGGPGIKAGKPLSTEGKHYVTPYRAALKKIDAALHSATQE